MNSSQRRELYVGVFPNHYWTAESLVDYFHRSIEGSSITDCRFYPCTSASKPNHSFVILTFEEATSVERCLAKREEIRLEHHVTLKRNLKAIEKKQRAICQYVSVHLKNSDPLFTAENVLAYFRPYGSIIEWKSLDRPRTFLLMFEDTDSVDRILLDQPHLVKEQALFLQKCYNPCTMESTRSISDSLEEWQRFLQETIDRLASSHQSKLNQLRKDFEDELFARRNYQLETNQSLLQSQQLERDLKEKLIEAQRVQNQLKEQLKQTLRRNRQIKADFTSWIRATKNVKLKSTD